MRRPFDGTDDDLFDVLNRTAAAVADAMVDVSDLDAAGDRPGQYRLDLVADSAALGVLGAAGFDVVSEESGRRNDARGNGSNIVVVVDPVDGSTNASRRLPMWATSLAAVDDGGVRAALVVDHAGGRRWWCVRGGGAWSDRGRLEVRPTRSMADAIVAINGAPRGRPGWQQFRAYGCASVELCLIAEGALDGYVAFADDGHGVWDYLGGMAIVSEAGGVVADAAGRPLVELRHDARRTIVAATSQSLLDDLVAVQRGDAT